MHFQFDGVDYKVADKDVAIATGIIQLPCGRQLRVDNWIVADARFLDEARIGKVSLTANHSHFATAVQA